MKTWSKNPELSVILCTYNNIAFIDESILSIFEQTFSNFELIVVDDGSSDGSFEHLKATYGDERLHLVRNESRKGLTKSLNFALDIARAPLIARLDADDVCEKLRLATQVKFLNSHPTIAVCGTWATQIDILGRTIGVLSPPTSCTSIAHSIWRLNPLIHSSVMISRNVVGDFRYPLLPVCQDYGLWYDFLRRNHKLVNIPRRLVRLRKHDGQIGATLRSEQLTTCYEIFLTNNPSIEITYSDYLSLICLEFQKSPLERFAVWHRVRKMLGLSRWYQFVDTIKYSIQYYLVRSNEAANGKLNR